MSTESDKSTVVKKSISIDKTLFHKAKRRARIWRNFSNYLNHLIRADTDAATAERGAHK